MDGVSSDLGALGNSTFVDYMRQRLIPVVERTKV